MESQWSPMNRKKYTENQSSNSVDEAFSSTGNRLERGDSFHIIPNK